MLQGSEGGHTKEGKKGKKRKREGVGEGHLLGTGDLLFLAREEVEAYLQEALEESDGNNGDDEGGGGDTKGKCGDKGVTSRARRVVRRGDKGGEKEGDTGGEKGGAGSKDAPRQPLTTRGLA